jgi:predicted CoA-binding protein
MHDGNSDQTIRDILANTHRIAVVGASAKPWRPSFGVMRFLIDQGYDVTPVNPGLAGQTIHGRAVVASLAEAQPLDMVDLFRASRYVGPVVDRAVELGARTIWMQLNVIDQQAAARARSAGLVVVMDRCPVIEAHRLSH